MPKLKVFRTTVGFHDAYVAAPSKAAALRAWGASTDLFAMGAAEEVQDERLTANALAKPGVVIKRSRGTAADHMAATDNAGGSSPRRSKSAKPPTPRPSRLNLDEADAELTEAEADYSRVKAEFEAEDARITKRRQADRRKHEAKITAPSRAQEIVESEFRHAVDRWRSDPA